MACSARRLLQILFVQMVLAVVTGSITRSKRQSSSMYYLAYCPIRQGNYITYSNAMCYCRRTQGTDYDCRPVSSGTPAAATTQRPLTRPPQGSLPPLKPPPVAPPPPAPPNRPSTPPYVDTRPPTLRLLLHVHSYFG